MTEEAAALLSVAAIWGIAVLSPGPNSLILAHTALSQGRSATVRIIAGLLTATTMWVAFGLFGMTALVTAAPGALTAMKIVGGGYLVFLGARLLWHARRRHAATPNPTDAPPLRRPFRAGLITNATNPKTAAFMASIFVAAFPTDPAPWLGAAALAIIVCLSTMWYIAMVVVFGLPRMSRAYRRMRVWIDRAAGAVFVGFGARLATSD